MSNGLEEIDNYIATLGRKKNKKDEVDAAKRPPTSRMNVMQPEEESVSLGERVAAGPVGDFAESVLVSGPGEFAQGALRGATNIIVDTPKSYETLARAVPKLVGGEREEDESLWGKTKRTFGEAWEESVIPGSDEIVKPFVDAGDMIREEIGEERGEADEMGEITANLLALATGVAGATRAAGRGVSKVAKMEGKLARLSRIPQFFKGMKSKVMKALIDEGFTVRQVKAFVHNLGKVKGTEGKFNIRLNQVGNKISKHLQDFMLDEGERFYNSIENFMNNFGTVKVGIGNIKTELKRLARAKEELKTAGLSNWAVKQMDDLADKGQISVAKLHGIRKALRNKYAKYKGKNTQISTPEEQAWARELERVIGNTIDDTVQKTAQTRIATLPDDEAAALAETLERYSSINRRYADSMATAENVNRVLGSRVRVAGEAPSGGQPQVRPKGPEGIRNAQTSKHDLDQLAEFGRRYPKAKGDIDEATFLGTTERILNDFQGGELGMAMSVDKSGQMMPRTRGTPEWLATRPRVIRQGILGTADRAASKPVFETGTRVSLTSPGRSVGKMFGPNPETTLALGGNVANPLPEEDFATRAKRLKERVWK